MEEFTAEEINRMQEYERARGEKIIYSYDERCQIYRTKDKSVLLRATMGIQNAINARLNLDNEDSFDGPDDLWKLKVLKENLRAIRTVLSE